MSWIARFGCLLLSCVAIAAGCGSDDQDSTSTTTADGGGTDTGPTGPTTTISQNGITWVLDGQVDHGTYANGDTWVLGPVTVLSVSPGAQVQSVNLGSAICTGPYKSRDCTDLCEAQHPDMVALCTGGSEVDTKGDCLCTTGRNGWQVNPAAGRVTSGFDSRVGNHSFDPSLIPALPYQASAGQSLVKVVSRPENLPSEDNRPAIQSASVLTVVGQVPADRGATVFRPPYVGSEKPDYTVGQLKTDLLPSLAAVADMPSWTEVEDHVRYVQLEHIAGAPGMLLRPKDHLYYYAPENGGRRAEVALRLMIDEPMANRMPALIYFVQGGIDMLHALKNGQVWGAGGGEYPGMKLIMLFAAVMLDRPDFGAMVQNFEAYEDESLVFGENNLALWGHMDGYHPQEIAYWNDIVNEAIEGKEPSRKTLRDPYGYIDGGLSPGTGYQICCSIQSFKGTSLAMLLMPQLKTYWDFPALHNYTKRMVDHGAQAQPDPCAPADASDIAAGIGVEDPGTHYGVTFGPDGNGGCIQDTDASDGIGRFPTQDGVEKDGRSYHGSSALVHAMWAAYRSTVTE